MIYRFCGVLILVGIFLSQPIQQSSAQSDCPSPLRIATWNIENFDLGRARDSDQLETIANVFAAIDADIIAVQEIADPDALEILLDELEALTGRYYVYALSEYSNRRQRVGFVWDESVVELSSEAIELEELALSGNGLRPGLYADFTFNDYDFTLFVVHLKAQMDNGARIVRTAQSEIMVDWLLERPRYADEDVIFLGDFNDFADSVSLEPLAEVVDFTDEFLPTDEASYIGGDFFSRIDHIALTRGSGSADEFCSIDVFDYQDLALREDAYEALASDHLPVIAEFRTDNR
ncbi:MAG: endonuclease/exonuclease/phosphatase family protein [Chitinophagaceae bacterium]|nr:endonuclease/exonuclease/phosphatase family protein [Anaerolineae bacterium]